MSNGKLESIHIATTAKGAMQSLDQVEALAGLGLEADRYATRQGTFFKPAPDYELTLIEAEAGEQPEGGSQALLAVQPSTMRTRATDTPAIRRA